MMYLYYTHVQQKQLTKVFTKKKRRKYYTVSSFCFFTLNILRVANTVQVPNPNVV